MQKGIELLQIRRFHDDLRRGRKLRTLPGQRDHRQRRQGGVAGQQHSQCVIDSRFAVAGRVAQDRQVFLGLPAFVVLFPEAVVSQTEARGREEVVAVGVVGEGPRLAHQRIDDVAVVHRVLVPADQTRQRVGEFVRIPDFDAVGVEPGLRPLADQPAVHRIDAAVDVDQAPGIDAAPHLPEAALTLLGQFLQSRDLFGEPIPPAFVADPHHASQEARVLLAAGEVPAAPQEQRLVDGGLEVVVRRFGVAVLVRLPGVDPLPRQAVVSQQIAVAGADSRVADRLFTAALRLSLRCIRGTPPSSHKAFCNPSSNFSDGNSNCRWKGVLIAALHSVFGGNGDEGRLAATLQSALFATLAGTAGASAK